MATLIERRPALSECPLKSSAPLGAALAYLGIEGSVPLFHGAQGCTAFGLVLAVRHFKEAIPLQTTAMNETTTILGGEGQLEEALLNVAQRSRPRLIGVATTALVETRGEDFAGDLRAIRARRPELANTHIALAATPDYTGALEDGWAGAVSALVEEFVPPSTSARAGQAPTRIDILAGVHLTVADLDELAETVEAFGLVPVLCPNLARSLDGGMPTGHIATSLGGTTIEELRGLGTGIHVLAVGEHLRRPAETLAARTGNTVTVLPTLTGLGATDELVSLLSRLTGRAVPESQRRRRARLVDSMLDAHFHFTGRRVAVAADPDLLFALTKLVSGLGATVVCAVSSTANSTLLARVAAEQVVVGDLSDFERGAATGRAELLLTHSHGRQTAERLGLPLHRVGFPVFDRLGPQHEGTAGYVGTLRLVNELANLLADGTGHESQPRPTAAAHKQARRHTEEPCNKCDH